MQDLTKFLTRIQTFNFELIERIDPPNPLEGRLKQTEKHAYWIGKETTYWDSTTFNNEIKTTKDMAVINLCIYNADALDKLLIQLEKIKAKFNTVWVLFHTHYNESEDNYNYRFISSVGLTTYFIVNGYLPGNKDYLMDRDCVEAISDSLKLREKHLKELISEVEEMVDPPQTAKTYAAAKRKKQRGHKMKELENFIDSFSEKTNNSLPEKQSGAVTSEIIISGYPKFNQVYIETFIEILSPYFPNEHIDELKELITNNVQPKQPLIFNGNGKQLADAFKQLYEANMIISCKKTELEKWITANFAYVAQKVVKEFTEGYLGGIVSSDANPCKSPILEVKQKDGKYYIVASVRTKKNNKF